MHKVNIEYLMLNIHYYLFFAFNGLDIVSTLSIRKYVIYTSFIQSLLQINS